MDAVKAKRHRISNRHPAPGTGQDPVIDQRPFAMPEIRIASLYVVLASLWIVCSDIALQAMIGDNAKAVYAQMVKGLNFVITTGLLLYLVLHRAYGGWRKSEERRLETILAAREGYRELSSKLQNLREEERTMISREIHDELGQLLTGIKMRLRLIEDRLSDRDDRSLNPLIDDLVDAAEIIDESIVSVRRISSGLRPASLDDLGLAVALKDEAVQFTRRSGIPCHLWIGEMEPPLQPEQETAAFRIFQESLTNVARHAQAGGVDAECSVQDGVLRLSVRDDGVGVSPDVAAARDSFGLIGMRERAADAGGSLELDSTPGCGTTVRLAIPLANQTSTPSGPCR